MGLLHNAWQNKVCSFCQLYFRPQWILCNIVHDTRWQQLLTGWACWITSVPNTSKRVLSVVAARDRVCVLTSLAGPGATAARQPLFLQNLSSMKTMRMIRRSPIISPRTKPRPVRPCWYRSYNTSTKFCYSSATSGSNDWMVTKDHTPESWHVQN